MHTTDTAEMPGSITVAEVALSFPGALEVLKHHQLDYCCGGKKPFAEVCASQGLNPKSIWDELQFTLQSSGTDLRMRFDTWETPFLIDFILQHHHAYIRNAIPEILALLNKMCSVHGDEKPWLLDVRQVFGALAEELIRHMPKEEEILFPAMKSIAAGSAGDAAINFGLSGPIAAMEHEHESAGTLIKQLRKLTHQYRAPADACTTFRACYMLLSQFDQDLMQHIHLENNILFPRATQIHFQ